MSNETVKIDIVNKSEVSLYCNDNHPFVCSVIHTTFFYKSQKWFNKIHLNVKKAFGDVLIINS